METRARRRAGPRSSRPASAAARCRRPSAGDEARAARRRGRGRTRREPRRARPAPLRVLGLDGLPYQHRAAGRRRPQRPAGRVRPRHAAHARRRPREVGDQRVGRRRLRPLRVREGCASWAGTSSGMQRVISVAPASPFAPAGSCAIFGNPWRGGGGAFLGPSSSALPRRFPGASPPAASPRERVVAEAATAGAGARRRGRRRSRGPRAPSASTRRARGRRRGTAPASARSARPMKS